MRAWDLAIVGAGPAGAAAALGALRAYPGLRVVMLDRSTFPRDKACGDGIAPQVVDLLGDVGAGSVVADRVAVSTLRLRRGALDASRRMAQPAWVVPRAELDLRLVTAACDAGAVLLHDRVRRVKPGAPTVLDDRHEARVVVGADGAHSVVRQALGLMPGPAAVALRGYAPTPTSRAGEQVIVFDTARRPAYAWSFDRGDGLCNVGYGVLTGQAQQGSTGLTKAHLLARLDALLPGATEGGTSWKGARLPLSSGRWRPRPGAILLAGDAAGLVNPMTGEGIYYAVATGLAAGRAAAEALAAGDPGSAGSRHAAAVGPLLDTHLRHVRLAGRLCRHGAVLGAGLRAASADQRVFDDLVELGLARGLITPAVAGGLARELARSVIGPRTPSTTPTPEESPSCES
ncbi:MAG: geranylgeranyl reductase family protein [Nocardioides sp.]